MNLDEALDRFCTTEAGPQDCRSSMRHAGRHLASRAGLDDRHTVVPVLRAGVALWPGVADHIGAPRTRSVLARHHGGERMVATTWVAGLPAAEEEVVILDVVLARGDTALAVLRNLHAAGPRADVRLVVAFAAPEGLDAVSAAHPGTRVEYGRLADLVDDDGRIVPSTHGDAGDKLFGRRRPRQPLS